MYACTFFGHRDCTADIEQILKETIINLIKEKNVTIFYVGTSGNFDRLVLKVLHELTGYYDILISVVLAYFPPKNFDALTEHYSIFPDDLEYVPKKFAINYRNDYMLKNSDFVVSYITKNTGGAVKFTQKALRQKKVVINLNQFVSK